MTLGSPGFLENRVPPLLVGLACAGIMQYLASQSAALIIPRVALLIMAVGFCTAGLVVMFAGLVSMRRAKTTINPHKPDTATALVTNGIYRYTRNPMYLGMLFLLVAWAAYLSSLIAVVGVCAFWIYIERFQIRPEERVLESLFGSEFSDYMSRVSRWL